MENNNNQNFKGGRKNNNRPNNRNRGDSRVRIKRFDNGMNQPQNFRPPKRQTHLLARLKLKYGDNYLPISHTAGEFTLSNIRMFIKDLFGGSVNIPEFQQEIMTPLILGKMCEVARSEVRQAWIIHNATIYMMNNPIFQAQAGIDPKSMVTTTNDMTIMWIIWDVVHKSLEAALNSGMMNAIIDGINYLRTVQSPAHGRSVVKDYIRNNDFDPKRYDLNKMTHPQQIQIQDDQPR